MGYSKKGLRNKQKNDRRAGAKHKDKIKLIKKIEGGKKVRASKKAATILRVGVSKDDGVGNPSVDDLFASLGDKEEDVQEIAPTDDLSLDELAALSDGVERHEEELQAIREKDPEFYGFLVEQDKQFLEFRAQAVQGESSESKKSAKKKKGAPDLGAAQQAQEPCRLLTMERFKQLQGLAGSSFTAFKALLSVYRTAVRSMEGAGAPDVEAQLDTEEVAPEDREKRQEQVLQQRRRAEEGRGKRQVQGSVMTIDSEATFSEVLEWSIANLPKLLRQYGGDQPQGTAGAGGKKKDKKFQFKKRDKKVDPGSGTPEGPASEGAALSAAGLLDPTGLERWSRIKVLSNIFWEETLFLLSHLTAPAMLEFVLRSCSTREALCWLWPFKLLRTRFLGLCCTLWASSSPSATQSVPLLAFLVVRNMAAIAVHAPSPAGGPDAKVQVTQLEALIRTALGAFAAAAASRYSWRSVSHFRFMENCIIELFRVDDATTYRVGYTCVRQLAIVLRNACVATSQGGGAKGSGKGQKGTQKAEKPSGKKRDMEALVSWPTVRAIYLWTRAVGSVPALRPLAYALSMTTLGAVKCKIASLQHFPFVFHCLHCINQLSVSLKAFVPISAHLLKVLAVLMQALEKEHKRRAGGKRRWAGGNQPGDDDVDSAPVLKFKAPQIELLLRFKEDQMTETALLEAIGASLFALFTDHLGLLSRSAAFPELATPVLLHLRRHSKHCSSLSLRKQLGALLAACEESLVAVRRHRDALTEAPAPGLLLMLDAEATTLARQRTQLLRRRAAEERQGAEAESSAAAEIRSAQDATRGEKRKAQGGETVAEKGPSSKKKKKSRSEQKPAKAPGGQVPAAAKAKAAVTKGKHALEASGFSSGEE